MQSYFAQCLDSLLGLLIICIFSIVLESGCPLASVWNSCLLFQLRLPKNLTLLQNLWQVFTNQCLNDNFYSRHTLSYYLSYSLITDMPLCTLIHKLLKKICSGMYPCLFSLWKKIILLNILLLSKNQVIENIMLTCTLYSICMKIIMVFYNEMYL